MNNLKIAIKKIISKHAALICSPWSELQKDIIEVIDCDNAEKRLQSKLRLTQSIHSDGLNKDPMLSYAEELSRLYFVLRDTIGKMDVALEKSEDYPAELSKDDVFDIRVFLKEAEVLLESEFEVFAKFSD